MLGCSSPCEATMDGRYGQVDEAGGNAPTRRGEGVQGGIERVVAEEGPRRVRDVGGNALRGEGLQDGRERQGAQ